MDCVKVYNSVKEPELNEIIRTARARKLPVIGHVPRTLTMTHAVELGMQYLEHIRITGGFAVRVTPNHAQLAIS